LHRWIALVALLTACSSYETKRVRELLIEKGFGSRAQGDATVENYVAGGDLIAFILPPQAYQDPASQQLYRLTLPQPVSIDGRIHIPYIGPVPVLGLTAPQLSTLVRSLLREQFQYEIDVQATITGLSKNVYAFGETLRKGVVPIGGPDLPPDLTLLRAISVIGWTGLANLSRVYVIRPDAEHPLHVEVNVYEMITTGRTRYNLQLRENDIIYIPPTFLGLIARILERAFAPIAVAVDAMFGVANLRGAFDYVTGRSDVFYYRF
jgi:protein involved in polysaccharide export with SLBB domain